MNQDDFLNLRWCLLKLIAAHNFNFTDVIFVHAHIDFVGHAVFAFVRKINIRLGTAEADHVLSSTV